MPSGQECRTLTFDIFTPTAVRHYKNPATGCRLPQKVHGKITILTHDEIYRLLMQAMYDGMFEMLFLDLTTGLRRGELVALKWSDLNIQKSELKIRRQYTRIKGELVISKPKTPSAIRTIKLTKITMKVLKRYKQGACGEWMFPSPKGPNRPIDPEACGRRLNRILENAGCRHIRFHDISISMIAFSAAPSQIQATYFVRFIIHPPCENESSWFSKPCTHRTWEQFPQGSHSDMLHSS